ncbi:iron-containing alcohol dehydrogenase [Edwardsiella piscicida C07-087]|uniref:iron-containing alcohol dehydrogenase n=1 Tax=Edwardsiella piscicida TaxID=1263550 RepID=UPI0002C090CD|nr:iron-containing alcohol dehydrogenase [Edwardsiella piscicida]AGH73385.1 iron-containing alcohol dehydrogenase [Edwardsiella piscicida C07-087]
MFNFDYYNPTRILFGGERIADIPQHIPAEARILITYGGNSARQFGYLDEVRRVLGPRIIGEFGGIEANPELETLLKAVQQVREQRIDFLLAIGGGSAIDGSKFIAAAAHYAGDPWEMWRQKRPPQRVLPLGCILTLPGTASEMNPTAVVSHRRLGAKVGYSHPALFPRFSVLDPHKSYTLPARQVANGVVDAFVHVMEQYLTYPVYARVQDRLAEGLLLTLLEEGPRALSEPHSYDVRASVMWAASMALNGMVGAGVPQDWSSHRIGHQLTALYGMDHALTLAILLPAVMRVQQQDKRLKLLQYAERVWGLRSGSEEERIASAIEHTERFFSDMGMQTRLSACGLEESCIDAVIDNLRRFQLLPLGERQNIDETAARRILSLSY